MTTAKMIFQSLNAFAPFGTQCDWDNSGLLCGDPEREVTCAAFSLDLTEQTIALAKQAGAELLITHHPVIFHAKKNLLAGDPVYTLCRSGIAAISVHTPWDGADGGVNDVLCGLLGLENVRPLPSAESPVPMARLGDCAPCAPETFAKQVAAALGTTVQLVRGSGEIKTAGVCGGAGMDFFFDALSNGADAYVTGEAKHHELLLAADSGKTLVVAGHFATEYPSMAALRQKVQAAFPALKTVLLAQPDPVSFVKAEG